MLGKANLFADECYKGNFIGIDFGINQDLTNDLTENWRDFNKKFIPIYINNRPEKTKISAGLACGALYTVSKGIKLNDIVFCPNGNGSYLVGEVLENYSYHPGENLPHQRKIRWYSKAIDRSEMSQALQNSSGSIGTVSDISKYADEIEALISGNQPATLISTDATVENASEFALEMHLEHFLVKNWNQTELGKKYDIYEEEGELVGQQYPSDTPRFLES